MSLGSLLDFAMLTVLLGLAFLSISVCVGREVIFPSISSLEYGEGQSYQTPVGEKDDVLQGNAKYAGLTTFANLPWVHCLSESEDIEAYDIAFLGAPFDTGTTARPGARFGPSGIRWGSRRINGAGAWSPYTHENSFQSWAKIVDCGDAPLTFLDNTVALRQLGNAHKAVSGRKANASDASTAPRIIALGGDHTTTLAALRSAAHHWGPVSVLHFDRSIFPEIHLALLIV
jgi:agmatinase